MVQELMPMALWMGMRDLGGTWCETIEEQGVRPKERFRFLRDYKNKAFLDILMCWGLGASSSLTYRPDWYRNTFVEWAQEVLRLLILPDIARHNPIRQENWCGVPICPYPYATESFPPPRFLHSGNVSFWWKEEPIPLWVRKPLSFKGDGESSRSDKNSKAKAKKRKRGE